MRVLIVILILFSLSQAQDTNRIVVDIERFTALVNNTNELNRFRQENAALDSAYQNQLRAFNQLDTMRLQLQSLITNANLVIKNKSLESEVWRDRSNHYKARFEFVNDLAIASIVGGIAAWASEDPITGAASAVGMYILQMFRITRFSL